MANQGSKTSPDRTFDPLSEYGSNAYCASVLGKSVALFLTHRAATCVRRRLTIGLALLRGGAAAYLGSPKVWQASGADRPGMGR